jgi:ATP-dependent exoDNAse (exonuclease V) alpha subunit
MLRADLLEAIDYSLRKNGGDPSKPFGGKQIIFVGDLFQLPPVAIGGDEVDQYLFRELYESPYFFESDAYKRLAPDFLQFKKSHRQKDDVDFVNLLDLIRQCDADEWTLERINKRVNPSYVPEPNEFSITLTATNANADAVNRRRLLELTTPSYFFMADIKGNFDDQYSSGSTVLELKKDAQVIFVRNDSSGKGRWVNGTIGKIEFIANDLIEVRLPDGNVYKVDKEVWERFNYKYDRGKSRVTAEVKGTFTQYPIKLAWAITIHKSQGLTFDKVIIDLGSGAFVNGQLYTALSRSRTLDGIVLRRAIQARDVIQDERLMAFHNRLPL